MERPLSDVMEDYLARFDMGLSAVSPRTRSIYLHATRCFLHYLETELGLVAIPLESVSREHAREWLRYLERQGRASGTIRTMYQAVSQFFKAMTEDGEIPSNVFAGLRTPEVKMKEPAILTPEEVQDLLDACKRDRTIWGARDRAVIFTLYDTGLRRAELLNVRQDDINIKAGAILVTGKGSRERWAPFSSNAFRALMQYMTARKRWIADRPWWRREALLGAPIWVSSRGDSLTEAGLASLLKRRAREAGVQKRVTPHAFRHTSATVQAGEHIPEEELRAKMGWTPGSKMLFRYTRTSLAERAIEGHRRYGPGNRLKL